MSFQNELQPVPAAVTHLCQGPNFITAIEIIFFCYFPSGRRNRRVYFKYQAKGLLVGILQETAQDASWTELIHILKISYFQNTNLITLEMLL